MRSLFGCMMLSAIVFALLGLGVPTVSANSFNPLPVTVSGGLPGTVTGSFTTSLDVTLSLVTYDYNGDLVGPPGTVFFDTGFLTSEVCPTGYSGSCYTFVGGMANAITPKQAVLADTAYLFANGFVNAHNGSLLMTVNLKPDGFFVVSGTASMTGTYSVSSNGFTLTAAQVNIDAAVIPEPSTLVLFGTGLVGVAGLLRHQVRRKCRFFEQMT